MFIKMCSACKGKFLWRSDIQCFSYLTLGNKNEMDLMQCK